MVYVFTATGTNAGNDPVIFALAAPNTKWKWRWNLCIGVTAKLLSTTNISRPVVNAPFAGVYRYVLDVTNAFGCKATTKTYCYHYRVTEAKLFAGNDTAVAVNQPLQLNAVDVNNGGFISYLWTPSSGLNSTVVKNPVAIFNSPIGNNGIIWLRANCKRRMYCHR